MENLNPQAVWQFFAALCNIPHPSGHLDAVRDYICGIGHDLGLEVGVDKMGNVLISKPATPGREGVESLLLEAHMDMVPQANTDVNHDFEKDPIALRKVGESVYATGTTLGADNGIGVAAMLAVLADKELQHGPIECLFTVDEETGMTGANALSETSFKSRKMINLDTETEGELMVGCAGAVNMQTEFKYRMDKDVPDGDVAMLLSLTGLAGGHSGMDIHLARANACKLMFRFLKHAVVNFEARLASVNGGGMRNAIPREAFAVITIPAELVDDMKDEVAYYNDLFNYEYRGIEKSICFTAEETSLPKSLIPEEIQDDVINCVEACFNGVWRMVPDMAGVVEASSNLASVITSEEETRIQFLIRSLNEETKRALASQLQSAFLLGGAKVDFGAAYPSWELDRNSQFVALAKDVYKSTFGTDVKVNMVHCGLECGVISANVPHLDIVSFGPTIHHPHSPEESVEIESVERFWKYLTALIGAMK